MDSFFAFTDECGNYQKTRGKKSLATHPYYVRATVIISLEDYLTLQKEMDEIKSTYGLDANVEVKWAHLGSAIKNNYKDIPHSLTVNEIKEYFSRLLKKMTELESVKLYYTMTDNAEIGQVSETALIRMHLQNAFQRVQQVMEQVNGYAIVVADDMNQKNKILKQAIYEMTLQGDYVQYSKVKKGLYIDFSDQCPGLQLADICAGIFTATLKYAMAKPQDRHKFLFARNALMKTAYKSIRYGFEHPPIVDVYRYGIKEVPNGAGYSLATAVSKAVGENIYNDFMKEFDQ